LIESPIAGSIIASGFLFRQLLEQKPSYTVN